jgi:hypothetical protein
MATLKLTVGDMIIDVHMVDGTPDHEVTCTDEFSGVTHSVRRGEADALSLVGAFLLLETELDSKAIQDFWKAAFPQPDFNP